MALFQLLTTSPVLAAFPVNLPAYTSQQPAPANNFNATIETAAYTYNIKVPAKTDSNKATATKSRGLAILFGVLFGALGIHRFYLGYTWQGALQALAYPALIAGILLLTFPPAGIAAASATAYSIVCLLVAAAIWIWRWVDVFRLISGSLKPADGSEYRD